MIYMDNFLYFIAKKLYINTGYPMPFYFEKIKFSKQHPLIGDLELASIPSWIEKSFNHFLQHFLWYPLDFFSNSLL